MPEGSEGLLEGSEGQPAGSEGQPAGSKGQPEGVCTYGHMDGISPHSRGLFPLLGPLPTKGGDTFRTDHFP